MPGAWSSGALVQREGVGAGAVRLRLLPVRGPGGADRGPRVARVGGCDTCGRAHGAMWRSFGSGRDAAAGRSGRARPKLRARRRQRPQQRRTRRPPPVPKTRAPPKLNFFARNFRGRAEYRPGPTRPDPIRPATRPDPTRCRCRCGHAGKRVAVVVAAAERRATSTRAAESGRERQRGAESGRERQRETEGGGLRARKGGLRARGRL